MTEPAPTRPPNRAAYDRAMRANRVFARMVEGLAYPEIAAAEGLSVWRVRVIVQEALDRWDIEPRKVCARPDRAAR